LLLVSWNVAGRVSAGHEEVVRVDHRQSARDLERVGRDVERLVLARAVSLHLDDRVIVDGRRTIVF
jgi:formyltetrahydrofolate deformylase